MKEGTSLCFEITLRIVAQPLTTSNQALLQGIRSLASEMKSRGRERGIMFRHTPLFHCRPYPPLDADVPFQSTKTRRNSGSSRGNGDNGQVTAMCLQEIGTSNPSSGRRFPSITMLEADALSISEGRQETIR